MGNHGVSIINFLEKPWQETTSVEWCPLIGTFQPVNSDQVVLMVDIFSKGLRGFCNYKKNTMKRGYFHLLFITNKLK